jgi:CRP-like cAMP-binding protein
MAETAPDPDAEYFRTFTKGSIIFEDGQRAKDMYIVKSGEVEISKVFGKVEKRLGVMVPGEIFGEMAVIDSLPRSATARALTDCTLLPLDSSTFEQVLRLYPEVAVGLLRRLSNRLRHHEERAATEISEPMPPPLNPRLEHPESGNVYALHGDRPNFIGRFDPETSASPEIDLFSVDVSRTLSRRHAHITRQIDRFYLAEEEGVRNGTYIAELRLSPGQTVELHEGDRLRFGKVDLIFKLH